MLLRGKWNLIEWKSNLKWGLCDIQIGRLHNIKIKVCVHYWTLHKRSSIDFFINYSCCYVVDHTVQAVCCNMASNTIPNSQQSIKLTVYVKAEAAVCNKCAYKITDNGVYSFPIISHFTRLLCCVMYAFLLWLENLLLFNMNILVCYYLHSIILQARYAIYYVLV